jgi:hypothetical protein
MVGVANPSLTKTVTVTVTKINRLPLRDVTAAAGRHSCIGPWLPAAPKPVQFPFPETRRAKVGAPVQSQVPVLLCWCRARPGPLGSITSQSKRQLVTAAAVQVHARHYRQR